MTSWPGLEVIFVISCSTQLNMKFILLKNVKMPTIIVGVLKQVSILSFYELS